MDMYACKSKTKNDLHNWFINGLFDKRVKGIGMSSQKVMPDIGLVRVTTTQDKNSNEAHHFLLFFKRRGLFEHIMQKSHKSKI